MPSDKPPPPMPPPNIHVRGGGRHPKPPGMERGGPHQLPPAHLLALAGLALLVAAVLAYVAVNA